MTITEYTEFVMQFLSLSVFMIPVILLVRFGTLVFGRTVRAGTRYFLWLLVLAGMLVPMLLPVPVMVEIPVGEVERFQIIERITQPDGTTDTAIIPYSEYENRMEQGVYGEEDAVNAKLADDTLRISRIDLVEILPVVWLTGAALFLLWNLGGYLLVMLRFRHTFVPAPASLNEQTRTLGAVRGMKRVPKVYTSEAVRSPMLCGFFRPVIVLPRMELAESEAAGVLAHELTHFRRGDLWIQLLGLLVCTIHWFNPAVHLADRWMREEMELSCDEAVLTGQGEDVRSAYGNVMLSILRQCRKRTVPMTTHFSPRKRMMQARFENIMDTRQKKWGLLWIAAVLVLCVLAGSAVACVQEKVVETVSGTNLSFANVGYDSKGWLHRIDFRDKGRFYSDFYSDEDIVQAYPETNYIAVFANGSLLTDPDGTPALPARETEDGTYLVDVMAILLTMDPDAGYGLEGGYSDLENGKWGAWFSYRIDGVVYEIVFDNLPSRNPKKCVTINETVVDIPFTLEIRKDAADTLSWRIWVSPEDAALLLGAEYAAFHLPEDAVVNGEPYLSYDFSQNFYLYNQPHLVFWRYPESASVLSAEEAVAKLEEKLIRAYENTYGTFVPLEEEPASSPYPGDDVMFRWTIPHLEVTGENDRFWRIAFVWDFLVDKYTGEIIVHYNGENQSFHRFNPASAGALAFAG